MRRVSIPLAIPVPSARDLSGVNWTYVLIALLLAPSLIWICLDRGVWLWDQAWYGQVSTDLWFLLGHSPAQWADFMSNGLPTKPPGIVWLGQFFVPLRHVFGSVEAALLVSILLTQSVLLVILFRIGRGMFPGRRLIPLAGLLFASASQLFVGLSHQMFVEPLQAVVVAWSFYVALKAPEWPKARIVVHLGAALILGAMAKASSPMYCVFPCLYSAYLLVRRPGAPSFSTEWKSRFSRFLILLFGFLAIAGALWYYKHFGDVWQHMRDASSSDIALAYGSRDSIPHKLAIWWRVFTTAFLAPYLWWGCLAAIVVGSAYYVARRSSPLPIPGRRIQPVAVLSALQIGLLLFVVSLTISVDSRYIYALLPCAAILFMQICASLPRIALAALIALISLQWAVVNGVSLGFPKSLGDRSDRLLAMHLDRAQFDDLTRVVQLTSGVDGRFNIVAVEEPWLNANSMEFFAAKQRLETGKHAYYTSLGYAQKDVAAAMRRFEEFQIQYLITLSEYDQGSNPNFLNLVSLPVLTRVRRDPRFEQQPFQNQDGILLFRFSGGAPAAPKTENNTGDTSQASPVDPAGIPPSFVKAKQEKRGKSSLGFVNGSLPKQGYRARSFLVKSGGLVSCLGWAFDDLNNSTPEEVWIELTNVEANRHYYWKAARYNRHELAEAFHIPSITMSGFNCPAPLSPIPKGVYRTRILQIAGGVAAVSDFNAYEASPTIVVE